MNTGHKLISILVEQCSNLKMQGQVQSKRMTPFFSYDFYTFEYRSHTV
jgi:hypothetical protein